MCVYFVSYKGDKMIQLLSSLSNYDSKKDLWLFDISKYQSYFTEYEHNKGVYQR